MFRNRFSTALACLLAVLLLAPNSTTAQTNTVQAVAISPDGKVGFSYNPAEKKIFKWNTRFCWPLAEVPETDPSARLSASRQQWLAVARPKETQLYNEEMQPVRSFPGSGFISRSGNWVITRLDNTVQVQETATGAVKYQYPATSLSTFRSSLWNGKNFSEASLRLVLAGSDNVQVMDLATGTILFRKENIKKLTAVALDTTGTYLAIGYDDKEVLVVDLSTQKTHTSFSILTKEDLVWDLSFGGSKDVLFVLTGQEAAFWRISNPKKPVQFSAAAVASYMRYIDPITFSVVGGSRTILFSPRGFDVTDEGWFVFRGSSNTPYPYFFTPPRKYEVPPEYARLTGTPVKWNIEKTNLFVMLRLNRQGGVAEGVLVQDNGTVVEPRVDTEVEHYVYRSGLSGEEVFLQYKVNDLLHLRSAKNGLLAKLPYDELFFDPGYQLIPARTNGGYGLLNAAFKEVVPCSYELTRSSKSAYAAVQKNGLWGFVNAEGKEVVPCRYEEVKWANPWTNADWPVPVKTGGKWGYIDPTGKEVLPFEFDKAEPFRTLIGAAPGTLPTAQVEKNGKSYKIDLRGNILSK